MPRVFCAVLLWLCAVHGSEVCPPRFLVGSRRIGFPRGIRCLAQVCSLFTCLVSPDPRELPPLSEFPHVGPR